MAARRNGWMLGAEGFLIGGLLGGVIALLLAPKSGVETRHDINKYTRLARFKKRKLVADARTQSHEIIRKAEEILNKSKSFASGKYTGTVEGLEKEIQSIQVGINRAVETYKNYPESNTEKIVEEIFVDFDDPSVKNMNDEILPKQEGMGRRSD